MHRLVRISPFDSNARRHTSFASVWVFPVVDENIEIEIKESDCRIDTYRASGAGGQHVNTTDSAVRITHLPTNIAVASQQERSQIKNRAIAWAMLKSRLYELELKKREEKANAAAASKTEIGWGHQIRSYVLQPYQMVKDLRTGTQSSDPQKVLDGDIDAFLETALAQKMSGSRACQGGGYRLAGMGRFPPRPESPAHDGLRREGGPRQRRAGPGDADHHQALRDGLADQANSLAYRPGVAGSLPRMRRPTLRPSSRPRSAGATRTRAGHRNRRTPVALDGFAVRMRTARLPFPASGPPAPASSRPRGPAESDRGTLEDMLRHVPRMDLAFDGDCAQANGLNLPVVVINLPHRTDRWQMLCRRASAAGLTKLIRAPAVEGARLPDSQIVALLGSPAGRIDDAPRSHLTLTRPAIGCFLSHLSVWRWLLGTGLPRVLILEDDAAPAAGYSAERLRNVVDAIREEAGLVFLGCLIMGGLAERPENSELARVYYFNGTFAYLITPAACRRLVPHLLPLRSHVDHQISRVLIEQRHVFSAYYTQPRFFEPDWSLRSDCYVPLADETVADRELGQIIEVARRVLADEERPLLFAQSSS